MRIVCQKCAAAYAIDDRLISPKGVRAQCPRCRHLQIVKREVVRIVKAAENRVTAVLRGLERRRVSGFVQEKPYLVASYGPLTEIRKDPIEIDGLGMAVYDVAKQLVAISPDIPDETAQVFDQSKDPGRLGDIVAATVDVAHGLCRIAFTTTRPSTAIKMIMMAMTPISATAPPIGPSSSRAICPSDRPSRRIEQNSATKS